MTSNVKYHQMLNEIECKMSSNVKCCQISNVLYYIVLLYIEHTKYPAIQQNNKISLNTIKYCLCFLQNAFAYFSSAVTWFRRLFWNQTSDMIQKLLQIPTPTPSVQAKIFQLRLTLLSLFWINLKLYFHRKSSFCLC